MRFASLLIAVAVLSTVTANAQNSRDLHDFGGPLGATAAIDGYTPLCNVTRTSNGYLFGTASQGGGTLTNQGLGMVWELTSSAQYKNRHTFGGTTKNADGTTGPDGQDPIGAVTFDAAGNMYGTCYTGGAYYNPDNGFPIAGMVWEITAAGAYKDLYDFGVGETNGSDGVGPNAGVTFDDAGNMYGTCSQGGPPENDAGGTLWEITKSGTYKDLHDFNATLANGNPDGSNPMGAVTVDASGDLLGTCSAGGVGACGTVWRLSANGTYQTLHDFAGFGTNDGQDPTGAVAIDAAGNLYGTASAGGTNGSGMVWEITKSGTYKDLHDFGGTVTVASGAQGPDGSGPDGDIAIDAHGNLFGTAELGGADGVDQQFNTGGGVVWEITSAGKYLDLHDFDGIGTGADGMSGPDGSRPEAGVLIDPSVNVYGTCSMGGEIFGQGAGGMLWCISAATLESFKLSASEVTGGTSATGTISLAAGAPTGGVVVTLASNKSSATVPASVSIAEGAKTATFTVKTAAVNAEVAATITASMGGAKTTAALAIYPPSVSSITLNGSSVTGGSSLTGTVKLAAKAPTGGVAVALKSSSTSATVPASVTVPANATTATFTVETAAVASKTTAKVTGTDSPTNESASLTINPAVMSSITLSPSSVKGGSSSTATVKISGPAPTAGFKLTLSSSSSYATVPASVTIPAGQSSVTFTITTKKVTASKPVTIKATNGTTSKSATLTITP